ncbi:kinase-like protein [Karstenula rhodostoma CBS 690.94]|uniref:Kinase-like protein n=1 Tax=Karstenula rhodostoma CBS 690.94 TaxID=1392251 RepID=A0A9P4PMM5_9PLEO|nr:kinase-like protein [Karstenula rhodostoma CBS 690.94]
MSISEARDSSHNRLFQPSVARAIAAQLIRAVAFIHSRGVVHADLHEANILLRMPESIDNLTPDQLYKKYGQPELEKITRLDGKPLDQWVPTSGVLPIWFGDASDTISLRDSHIFLTDFSESFQPAVDIQQSSHTPFMLRPPEIILQPTSNVSVSFPAEIWSLACAVFAIMGQRPLFETWFPNKDRILEEHVDALGYLPEEWWTNWAHRHQCFNDQLERVDGSPRRLLEDRLEDSIQEPRKQSKMAEMNEEEKQAFLVLLRSMLSFRPETRPSAQQVLESSWMQKWAEPAFESLQDNVETSEIIL